MAGNDVIRGGGGNDDLRGETGNDIIYGDAGNDHINGGDGNDVIRGGAGDDNILGGVGNDIIYTDAGKETIDGGAGDDIIRFAASVKPGDGAFVVDVVDGEAGNDLADFSNAFFQVGGPGARFGIKADLNTPSVTLNRATDAFEVATLANIEHVSGTNLADTITGTDVSNTLRGNGGNDKLYGGDGDDKIYGGLGADTIEGGAGHDIIYGGDAGINNIDGGAGNDIIHGGNLRDVIAGGDHNDVIRGNAGNDVIDGGIGADTIYGGAGNDILRAGVGSGGSGLVETIYGEAGNDQLYGGTSTTLTANILKGGAGADSYFVTHGLRTEITDGNGVSKIDLTSAGIFSGLSTARGQGTSNLLNLLNNFGNGVENVDFSQSRNGRDLVLEISRDSSSVNGAGTNIMLMDLTIKNFYNGAANYNFVFNTGTVAEPVKITFNGNEFLNIFKPLRLSIDSKNKATPVVLEGGLGNDVLTGRNEATLTDVLRGNAGNDRLVGLAGKNELYGGAGNDYLVGFASGDDLYGGAGNDHLVGLGGGDTIDGGAGIDTADYRGSNAGVVMALSKTVGGGFTFVSGGHATGEVIRNIEIIQGSNPLRGVLFGDEFTLFARDAVAYTVFGNNGADEFTIDFTGAAGETTGRYLGDRLYGGNQVDSLALKGANTAGAVSINFVSGVMTLREGSNTRSSVVSQFENLDLTAYTSAHSLTFVGTAGGNRVTLGNFAPTGTGSVLNLVGGSGTDVLDFAGRTTALTVNLGAAANAVYGTGRVLGFENVVGGTGVDTLTGSRANNVLSGGAGNDILSGGAGNDILYGGAGFDKLYGGAGNDRLLGGADRDTLQGGAGSDYIDGGAGAGDTVSYAGETVGVNIVLRGANNAIFSRIGNSAERDIIKNVERIHGSEARDILTGNNANNEIIGYSGHDVIRGGGGVDDLRGGGGNDVFIFGAVRNAAYATGKTSLLGKVDGGDGIDTLDFSNSYFIDGTTRYGIIATSALVTSNAPTGDALKDIVKLSNSDVENIIGTNHADTITGGDGANRLVGGGGGDVLRGGGGDDVLIGGDGADDLNGDAGNDIIYGNAGGDTLRGHGGTNKLYGGAGYDTYTIHSEGSVDTIFDTGGKIELFVLAGDIKNSATVSAFVNHEGFSFRASPRDWTLIFKDGEITTTLTIKNFVQNAANYDFTLLGDVAFSGIQLRNLIVNRNIVSNSIGLVEGSLGVNTMRGGAAAQNFDGLAGNDRLFGLGGADTLKGGAGNDYIDGGVGNDVLLDGGAGNDVIIGGAGNDVLLDGGAGNDVIIGGAGNDGLAGGTGNDRFAGLGTATSGVDTIDGGDGDDLADFSGAGAVIRVNVGTAQAARFVNKSFGITVDFTTADAAKAVTGGRGAVAAANYGTLKNVEDIVGSRQTDTITLKISDADSNRLLLGAGNDVVNLKDAPIVLTDGQDIYDGGIGVDRLDLSGITNTDITNYIVLGNFDVLPGRDDFFADAVQTPAANLVLRNLGTAGKDSLASEASRDTILNGRAGYDTYTIAEAVAYSFTRTLLTSGTRNVDVKDSITRINDNGGLIDLTAFSGLSEDGARDFLTDGKIFAALSSAGHLTLSIDNGDTDNYIVINNFARNANAFSFKVSDDVSYRGGALLPYVVGANDGYITRAGADDVVRVAILRGFENVVGSAGQDQIFGTDAANSLSGGDGGDIIFGDDLGDALVTIFSSSIIGINAQAHEADRVGGNDILYGGKGGDILYGMAGNDRLYGGAGADKLYGGFGNDYLEGGAGADRIFGNLGRDTLSYANSVAGVSFDGSGRFTIGIQAYVVGDNVGGVTSDADGDTVSSIENVIGSAYADTLIGNNASGTANGRSGSSGETLNTYQSWATATSLLIDARGNQDGDQYQGANRLVGGAGNDVITGLSGNDVLLGGTGDDLLTGDGAGSSILLGGNIVPITSYGSDYIDGGAGIDTLSHRGEVTGVNIVLRGANNAIFSRIGNRAERDIIKNVENIIGSEVRDILTGNAGVNKLEGLAGNDIIRGGGGLDTLAGGAGNDVIYGDAGNDIITGGTGNDVIRGGAGNDNIDGGAGNDIIFTDAGKETIDAGADDDTIRFAASVKPGAAAFVVDVIDGGTGNDLADFTAAYFRIVNARFGIKVDLSTAEGSTIVDGVVIENTASVTLNRATNALEVATLDNIEHIYGTSLNDAIIGNDAVNRIRGNGGNDKLSGEGGADIIAGGAGNDIISGGAGNDTLRGEAGNDIITGGIGNDIIDGGLGNDILRGEDGDDTITGGDNNDQLHGGKGTNILIGGAGGDTYHITEGSTNTIRDNAGVIDLSLLGDLAKLGTLDFANLQVAGALKGFLELLHAGNLGSAVEFDASGLTLKIAKAAEGGGAPIVTSIVLEGFTLANAGSFAFRFLNAGGNKYVVGGNAIKAVISDQATARGTAPLNGGVFSDRLTGTAGINTLNGNAGGDILFGLGDNDNLNGGDGNDVIDGGAGADTIDGGSGNDIIRGGTGADTIDGGAGIDTVSYAASGGGVTLVLNADQGKTGFSGTAAHAQGDKVSGVENFIGTRFGDSFTLTVADATSAYTLDGGANLRSFDTLKLTGSSASGASAGTGFALNLATGKVSIGGSVSTIRNFERIDISALTTTGGQATITGSNRVDFITIGNGASAYNNDDGITGNLGGGNDVLLLGNYDVDSVGSKSTTFGLVGGNGVDTVNFAARTGDGATFYFADRGFERAIGSKQGDRFYSDDNANNVNGGLGRDTIDYSEAGSSVVVNLGLPAGRAQTGSVASQGDILTNIHDIVGSAHADILTGSSLYNVIEGGAGADTINGGAGIDTVSYSGSADGVNVDLNVMLRVGRIGYGYGRDGDAEGDRLLSIENIIGSAKADTLTGNHLNNRLEGGAGADTLNGGAGADILLGGAGNDILNGGAGVDTLLGGAGADTLKGGAGVDIYRIKLADGNSNTITDADGGIVRFDFAAVSGVKDNNDLVVADSGNSDGFRITDYYVGDNKDGYTIQQGSTNTDGVTTYTDFTGIPT